MNKSYKSQFGVSETMMRTEQILKTMDIPVIRSWEECRRSRTATPPKSGHCFRFTQSRYCTHARESGYINRITTKDISMGR